MTELPLRWLLVLLALGLCGPPSIQAAQINPRNPYRSFNISGINYGSMQWEREHGNNTRMKAAPGRRTFFRRR